MSLKWLGQKAKWSVSSPNSEFLGPFSCSFGNASFSWTWVQQSQELTKTLPLSKHLWWGVLKARAHMAVLTGYWSRWERCVQDWEATLGTSSRQPWSNRHSPLECTANCMPRVHHLQNLTAIWVPWQRDKDNYLWPQRVYYQAREAWTCHSKSVTQNTKATGSTLVRAKQTSEGPCASGSQKSVRSSDLGMSNGIVGWLSCVEANSESEKIKSLELFIDQALRTGLKGRRDLTVWVQIPLQTHYLTSFCTSAFLINQGWQ